MLAPPSGTSSNSTKVSSSLLFVSSCVPDGVSDGGSSRARKGGGVNANEMERVCGRPGERCMVITPAHSKASDGVSWAAGGVSD